MTHTEISNWRRDPTIAAIVKATFPDYRRTKVWVSAAETVTLYDLNWSGGTRAQYRACTTAGQPTGNADAHNAVAPWDQRAEGRTVPVPPGHVLAKGGDFCGKPAMLTLYVHPTDMPRYLPAPTV